MLRIPPKLVWTRTPTVYPPSASGSTRELVPMPPFQPNADVPVPPPTDPSSTGPPVASYKAWRTCSNWTGSAHMSLTQLSFVSPTMGLIVCSLSPGRESR